MIEIQPPHEIPSGSKRLFLAGSIELGAAEDWQGRVKQMLAGTDWVVLNPRRDAWDNSWQRSESDPRFLEQVTWELAAQEAADKILMYFDPTSKSPISLLELGLFGRSGKMVVVCPEGFWRKGNIDIVCKRYGIPQAESLEAALTVLCNLPPR